MRTSKGFTLIELLVVLAIMAILTAGIVTSLSPMLQAYRMDKNITTLAGVLEQAREAATSGNTYVWVAFTANPSTSSALSEANGVRAVVFESQDGTDALSNFTSSNLAISTSNDLMVLSLTQALPAIQLTAANVITSSSVPGISSLPALSPAATSLQGTMNLTLTVGGTNYTFTQALEFAPNGEGRVGNVDTNWYNFIEFGIESSINSKSPNVAVIRVARLTGRATVYRP